MISNGQGEIVSIKISPDVVDLMTSKCSKIWSSQRSAMHCAEQGVADKQMAQLTGGMGESLLD